MTMRNVRIFGKDEEIIDSRWTMREDYGASGHDPMQIKHCLMMKTTNEIFFLTVDRKHSFPEMISEYENAAVHEHNPHDGAPVDVWWPDTRKSGNQRGQGVYYTVGYLRIEPLPPEAQAESVVAVSKNEPDSIFYPIDKKTWQEVRMKNQTINMRDRDQAKAFLRHLWDREAKRKSTAILLKKSFTKPSSLFKAGNKPKNSGTAQKKDDIHFGALIQHVYDTCVGHYCPSKKKAPHKYYLRVYPDSDQT